MKTIVQMVEAGIGISVVITVGASFLRVLRDTDVLDYIKGAVFQIGDLLGANFGSLFFTILLGIFLVYIARWAVSWSSSNGGQTPNNNGN